MGSSVSSRATGRRTTSRALARLVPTTAVTLLLIASFGTSGAGAGAVPVAGIDLFGWLRPKPVPAPTAPAPTAPTPAPDPPAAVRPVDTDASESAPASDAPSAVERTETIVRSTSSQTDVAVSFVRLHVPLPDAALPHPEACDWLQYLRFRSVDGPSTPMRADAVAVLMPGLLEGANAFDPVARNTIRAERRRGRSVEVWALDRRANCLEDLTGLQNAESTGEPETMLGYYYGGKELDGHRFPGFSRDDAVLADLGLAQTLRDQYAVLTDELPSQPWREQHVICGGHSLGGFIQEAYAAFDFDGDPATTEDAGYRQCAGYIGFDTTLQSGLAQGKGAGIPELDAAIGGIVKSFSSTTLSALRSGKLSRHLTILGISPQTMMLLEPLGLLAYRHPDQEATALMARIPNTPDVAQFYHLAGSANLQRALFSKDSLRDYRYTYAGILGQLMDDNGSPFPLIRASFGYFSADAPLRRNLFPQQVLAVPVLGQLMGKGRLMLPQLQRASNRGLVGWVDRSALGNGATQIGAGVTDPNREITDASDMARILHEGPTNLTEAYFPTRLVVDLITASTGDRGGDLVNLRHGKVPITAPRKVVLAGDGVGAALGLRPTDSLVELPGYDHLDVLTASEQQTNGQPEGSSQTFADLIDSALAS